MRKIVQIAAIPSGVGETACNETIYALCEDGTLWYREWVRDKDEPYRVLFDNWMQVEPIPVAEVKAA